jgi:hypothetical protein
MGYKFNKGDKVIINNASMGWGDCGVVAGDIGVIVDIMRDADDSGVQRCVLNVVGKHDGWVCAMSDFVMGNERMLQSCQATQFINRMDLHFKDKLAQAKHRYEDEHRKLKEIENKITKRVDTDTDVFLKIKERVKDLRFDGTRMMFTTDKCVIPYYVSGIQETINVDMGFYKVEVNFDSGCVIMNQQETSKHLGGHYDHPHITGGSPCWGNYYEPVKKMIRTMDICGMIAISLDFLNSCDRAGWYRSVLHWLPQEQRTKLGVDDLCHRCEDVYDNCECERCSNCEEMVDDCNCNICEYCEYNEDECECNRCPDSYDRLEDNSFPDTGCSQCSLLIRNEDDDEWQCGYDRDYPNHSIGLECWTPNESNARYTTVIDGEDHVHQNEVTREQHAQNTLRAMSTTATAT